MDFRDRDGAALIIWHDPESAFEAWKACSAGRPCDYTGITYDRLRGGSGIQWPCTSTRPDGTERLYTDGRFNTDPDYCETYGHDLSTGGAYSAAEYRAKQPAGRAFLHAAHHEPPPEQVSAERPFLLTTGRIVYQFHTRTKTGRAPQLQAAAPDVWVELSGVDADALGIGEGDLVEVRSSRGAVRAPARVCGIRPGVLFVPFHYGDWDRPSDAAGDGDHARAANELTLTAWDPVSKQPTFKVAAVSVRKLADAHGLPSPAPTIGGPAPTAAAVPPTVGGEQAMTTSRREEVRR